MRETLVETYLVRRVRELGGDTYKFTSPGRRHVADRLVIGTAGGRLVFVECKRPGEKPRAGQLREHDRLRARGFVVRVVADKNEVDLLIGMLKLGAFFELAH